jgi:hypothetical protein
METDGQQKIAAVLICSQRGECALYASSGNTSLVPRHHSGRRRRFLRRESKAVIWRFEVFRRDSRPLIGALETSLAMGQGNTEYQTPECIEIFPQRSIGCHHMDGNVG